MKIVKGCVGTWQEVGMNLEAPRAPERCEVPGALCICEVLEGTGGARLIWCTVHGHVRY